ncbi:MAG: hypothetical protein ACREH4_06520 [Vitreimonas sp.]
MGLEDAIKAQFGQGEEQPTRIPFHSAWAMAARSIGRPVGADDYRGAVHALVDQAYLRPRQVHATTPLVRRLEGPTVPREKELMPSVAEWLRDAWLHKVAAPPGADIRDRILEDTSEKRVRGAGRNANPDFLAALRCLQRGAGGAYEVEVVSFELKAGDANVDPAVQEAQRHGNYVNQSYLLWHVDGVATQESAVENLSEQCRIHEIGLIVFSDPENGETYREVRPAPRKMPTWEIRSAFLSRRVRPEAFDRIVGEYDPGDGDA